MHVCKADMRMHSHQINLSGEVCAIAVLLGITAVRACPQSAGLGSMLKQCNRSASTPGTWLAYPLTNGTLAAGACAHDPSSPPQYRMQIQNLHLLPSDIIFYIGTA